MASRSTDTRSQIIEAARSCLLADGYANLSTRRVADTAGVPLSQIHYHFGGKPGLVLAMLEAENRRLIDRQRRMYGTDMPLWKRYEQACDFLEEDLASGYVRVLQEMIAAGWADDAVAQAIATQLQGWFDILDEVAAEAQARFGSLGPLTASDVSTLIGLSFLGGEALILLRQPQWASRARAALRSVGRLIRDLEEQGAAASKSR